VASRLYIGASPPAQLLAFDRVRRQPPLPSLAPPSPIRPPSSAASPDPCSSHRQFRGWRRVASAGATHHAQSGRRTRGESSFSAEATAEHTRRKTAGTDRGSAAPARGRRTSPGAKRRESAAREGATAERLGRAVTAAGQRSCPDRCRPTPRTATDAAVATGASRGGPHTALSRPRHPPIRTGAQPRPSSSNQTECNRRVPNTSHRTTIASRMNVRQ